MSEALETAALAALDLLVEHRDSIISSETITATRCPDVGYIREPEIRDEIAKLNALIGAIDPEDDKGKVMLVDGGPELHPNAADTVIQYGHDYAAMKEATA